MCDYCGHIPCSKPENCAKAERVYQLLVNSAVERMEEQLHVDNVIDQMEEQFSGANNNLP